jgi:hypothetical protein
MISQLHDQPRPSYTRSTGGEHDEGLPTDQATMDIGQGRSTESTDRATEAPHHDEHTTSQTPSTTTQPPLTTRTTLHHSSPPSSSHSSAFQHPRLSPSLSPPTVDHRSGSVSLPGLPFALPPPSSPWPTTPLHSPPPNLPVRPVCPVRLQSLSSSRPRHGRHHRRPRCAAPRAGRRQR